MPIACAFIATWGTQSSCTCSRTNSCQTHVRKRVSVPFLISFLEPYQTIVRGEEGFNYCKKYFGGGKRVDSNVTCIVEFECEEKMVADLFSRFSKAEDGCMSTGLGHKAGKTLSIFNDCLKRGETTFRIVFVRRLKKGK
jgi:hypothetical protein